MLFGIRNASLGVDTKNYIKAYNSGSSYFEPFFDFVIKFLNYFNFNSTFFLFFVCFISNFLIAVSYYFFFKKKRFTLLASWMFLSTSTAFFGSVNVIRQHFAASFLLLGISLIDKSRKQLLLSLLFFCIASSIHISSFGIAFVFLAIKFYLNKRTINLKLITILSFLFLLLPNLILRINIPILNNIKRYIESERHDDNYLYKIIILLLVIVLIYFLSKKNHATGKEVNTHFLFLLSVFFNSLIFISTPEAADRVLFYMNYIFPVLYLTIYKFFKEKVVYVWLISTLTVFYLLFVYNYRAVTNNFLM